MNSLWRTGLCGNLLSFYRNIFSWVTDFFSTFHLIIIKIRLFIVMTSKCWDPADRFSLEEEGLNCSLTYLLTTSSKEEKWRPLKQLSCVISMRDYVFTSLFKVSDFPIFYLFDPNFYLCHHYNYTLGYGNVELIADKIRENAAFNNGRINEKTELYMHHWIHTWQKKLIKTNVLHHISSPWIPTRIFINH